MSEGVCWLVKLLQLLETFQLKLAAVGMHTLTDVIDNTLNTTFKVRRLFGAETKTVDYSQSLSLFANLTKDTKFAKRSY